MAKKANIGAGIALDGEKEFRKAITSINKDLGVLGSEMKKVSAEFKGNANSIESLTEKDKVLNKQLETQKEKVEAVKKALENSKQQYGENDNKTKDWQKTLNNAEADLYKLTKEIEDNEDAMEDAAKASDDMGDEIEKAGDKADKSGPKFEKLGSMLKASAVAMGTVAVAAGAAAIKLGKEVVEQFGELEQNLGGSEAVFGKYAKSIQKTAEDAYKNLGTSQSDYLATANKMGALFQGSGIEQQKSLELTEKAMQRAADMASVMGIDMQVALDSVAGAAKGNFTMMDNLGVAMNATNIEAYALAQGLDFTWKTATQAEKAEVAMQMFFENTEQYAGNFAKESTETISGSIGLLQAALGSFTAGLGNANADMQNLTGNLVDAFKAVVENVTPIIENLTAVLPEVFETLLGVISELLPQLWEIATNLFMQVLEVALELIPELIPATIDALMMIVNTLIENLPLIINAAIELVLALATGLIDALPELIPAIINAVLTIVETLIDNIDMLVDAGISLIIGLAEGLIDALPELIDKIPVIIESLLMALTRNLPKLTAMGIELSVKLALGIIKAIPNLVAAIPKIIFSLTTAFISYLGEFFNMGGKLIGKVKDGLSSINLVSVGTDLVKGIWNGISDATSWILNKIKGFGSSITKGIKSIFGIKSPSTVFRDEVGKNLALGLGEGFTDEMDSITKDMGNSIPTDFEVNGAYNMSANNTNSIGGLDFGLLSSVIATSVSNALSNLSGDTVLIVGNEELARATSKGMKSLNRRMSLVLE